MIWEQRNVIMFRAAKEQHERL